MLQRFEQGHSQLPFSSLLAGAHDAAEGNDVLRVVRRVQEVQGLSIQQGFTVARTGYVLFRTRKYGSGLVSPKSPPGAGLKGNNPSCGLDSEKSKHNKVTLAKHMLPQRGLQPQRALLAGAEKRIIDDTICQTRNHHF